MQDLRIRDLTEGEAHEHSGDTIGLFINGKFGYQKLIITAFNIRDMKRLVPEISLAILDYEENNE